MDATKPGDEGGGGVCPYVNVNDERCGTRFRLARIEQAFSVCFGAFHGCPMYHRLNREQAGNVVSDESRVMAIAAAATGTTTVPTVSIKVSRGARCYEIDLPLRATGS